MNYATSYLVPLRYTGEHEETSECDSLRSYVVEFLNERVHSSNFCFEGPTRMKISEFASLLTYLQNFVDAVYLWTTTDKLLPHFVESGAVYAVDIFVEGHHRLQAVKLAYAVLAFLAKAKECYNADFSVCSAAWRICETGSYCLLTLDKCFEPAFKASVLQAQRRVGPGLSSYDGMPITTLQNADAMLRGYEILDHVVTQTREAEVALFCRNIRPEVVVVLLVTSYDNEGDGAALVVRRRKPWWNCMQGALPTGCIYIVVVWSMVAIPTWIDEATTVPPLPSGAVRRKLKREGHIINSRVSRWVVMRRISVANISRYGAAFISVDGGPMVPQYDGVIEPVWPVGE
ncbi:hypothetical protein GALMADRAFT_207983 [Galerina marginata CBS 339.88]|uniref:Uncharacterized protein n=1 Tax=Galerina marginata (strain CBS 339.88) TaxID=685588 RepID=A0A067TD52_GALM3|nr:hypothetical protein GALMADRAFT_207983 [Galerina marginata CBS 339.88]